MHRLVISVGRMNCVGLVIPCSNYILCVWQYVFTCNIHTDTTALVDTTTQSGRFPHIIITYTRLPEHLVLNAPHGDA